MSSEFSGLKALLDKKKRDRMQGGASAPTPSAEPSIPPSGSSQFKPSFASSTQAPASAGVSRSTDFSATGRPSYLADIPASSGPAVRNAIPSLDDSELQVHGQLAQGGFSCVHRGVYRGCPVAIKKPLDLECGRDPKVLAEFEREADITSELRHPNIIQVMGASLVPPNLCLVFELAEGGSLFNFLHTNSRPLDSRAAIRIAVGVARALTFMHSARPAIIHRDIKSHNVLIDTHLTMAKLCDFGIAMRMSDASTMPSDQGTIMYMAPEILRGQVPTAASDVYSFGILLWEIVARQVPFDIPSAQTIKSNVLRGDRPPIPASMPPAISSLVRQCWIDDSYSRPDMASVLEQLSNML